MVIYKIKSLNTGLYSKGGQTPSFSKTGKTWNNIGHVKNHLNALDSHGKRVYAEHNVVVESYELVETHVSTQSYDDMMKDIQNIKREKQMALEERYAQRQKQYEFEQYERLKKQFEKN